MAWCAVVNCHNSNKRNPDKTFFTLPKEEPLRKEWVKLIKRTKLLKRVHVSSDHFAESFFDASWDLQTSLFYKDRAVKRKLIPDSKPTIFPYKEKPKERVASTKRAVKKSHDEVRIFAHHFLQHFLSRPNIAIINYILLLTFFYF